MATEILVTVTAVHKKTGKSVSVELNSLLRQIKKAPAVLSNYRDYTIHKEVLSVKKYQFEAWVHPKEGGDDRCYIYTIAAESKTAAEVILMEKLNKKSHLVGDYRFIKEI